MHNLNACKRLGTPPLAFVLLVAGLFAPRAALRPARAAAPSTAQEVPAEGLQLDDPAEPFVPVRPRTGRQEDHVRALALFAAGRVAEQKQDYAEALRLYERAFRFDPNAVAALREIVPLAFNLNRQEEGVRYALILAERDPADASLLRRLAIYLTDDGDSQRALKFYEEALKLYEKSNEKLSANTVLMWMEMGRLYFVAKQFDKAAHFFGMVVDALDNPKAYDLPPNVQEALLNKGELTYQLFGESFLEANRPDDALAAFEKVNGFKPDEALHLYNLARVDTKRKQPAQALAKLEEYFGKHFATQGTGPYELYAEALGQLGQEDQLIERLEKYRADDSESLPLSFFLAERYRKDGKLDQADPIYAELIEARQERPPLEAIVGLVDVYRQQKKADKLLALLGKSVGRAGSLTPLGDTGDALVKDREVAQAVVEAAQRQLAEEPAQLDYGQRMAAALLALSLEEYDTAQSLFNAAGEADEIKPEVLINWGLELFLASQYERAAKMFEQAIEEKKLPDDNPAVYFYLAGALEMSGQTDKAIERARQAAELKPDSPRFASRAAWIQFHARRLEKSRQSYQELIDRFDKQHDDAEVRDVLRDARLVMSNIAALRGADGRSRGMARTGARRVSRRYRRAERPGLPVGRRRQAPGVGPGHDPGGRRQRSEEHGLSRQPGVGFVSPGEVSRGDRGAEGGRGRRRP